MPAVPGHELGAKYGNHNRRLREAASTGFRSMLIGRDQGTEALLLLQGDLIGLGGWPASTYKDSPNGDGFHLIQGKRNAPVYGPCDLGDEADSQEGCYYGPRTERAVRDFQAKTGIDADGIAGMLTLQAMDLYLHFHMWPVEKHVCVEPFTHAFRNSRVGCANLRGRPRARKGPGASSQTRRTLRPCTRTYGALPIPRQARRSSCKALQDLPGATDPAVVRGWLLPVSCWSYAPPILVFLAESGRRFASPRSGDSGR